MNTFIVVEGISGVGKTTVAQELAKKLNAIYIKTPITPLDKMRAEIDTEYCSEAKALYYLAGIAELSKRITKLLETTSVVVDKYIYSSLVYPKINGVHFEIPTWANIRNPDYGFLVTVNEATRLERLVKRGSDLGVNKHIDPEKVRSMMGVYRSLNLVEVTNDGLIEETVNAIIGHIEGQK